jgi:hypothetical protein
VDTEAIHADGQRIHAQGSFSCDFGIDLSLFTESLATTIERDRIFLQRETIDETQPDSPGMIQKHIPFLPTGPTSAFAGGRYLFQGRAQAATYSDFIHRRYVYPGNTQFLQRPEFSNPECRDWGVIVAWNFEPVTTHTAMRTERFDTGRSTLVEELALDGELHALAPSVVEAASARGYAEVHLVHNAADHKVQLVYFVSRLSPVSPDTPDLAALGKIASDAPLGGDLAAKADLTRVFDRPSVVLTIWQPYAAGDHGTPSLWPNSPPIPQPACGDGVCTPSTGENGVNCPADCAPKCGDAVCQDGETPDKCPSDCALPFIE